jgi:Domain of unknown function (DUF4268)
MNELGRIERVDLRSIWTSEDGHFTPWLAQPENLEILGDALGIELELEAHEKDVGTFRADILCKNTAEKDSWVVIENQLERTDHKHLGQLLTYASGLQANTIVWVSAEFNDEHRAALDWLNRMTNNSVRFFGLEIELWKIGNSPPAPRFNVVCQPNDWEKTVHEATGALTDDEATPSQNLRIKYWTAFRSYLQEQKSKLRPQKPSRDHWYSFGIGTSHAHTAALLITREDKIAVELSLNSLDAKIIYHKLLEKKAEIEAIIGAPLEWREMADKKASRIVLFNSTNPYDETAWPQQFSWLQTYLEKFDQAFRQLLANKFSG